MYKYSLITKKTLLIPNISKEIFFFSLLLVLLPIALITGPAIPDIFLSLIAMYFLIKSCILKLWNYYRNPIVIGFLLFSIYGVLRSLCSDLAIESLTNEGSMFYFRYIFFSMGVWYLLDQNPNLIKWLLVSLVVCLIIVSIDGLYQYFNGYNFIGFSKHGNDRLTGLFGKEPILGRYIAHLSIFAFSLIYQKYKISKKNILLTILFLIICEIIVFLTGERSSFFILVLFTILMVVFIPQFRLYRLLGIVISFLLILGILEINPKAKQRMLEYTFDQVSQTRFHFLPYSVAHEEHYISAIKMFNDNPFFGIGTNTFRFQSQKSNYRSEIIDINSHPHNFYLQILAELGVVGFIFFGGFIFYVFFIGLKQFTIIYFIKNKHNLMPFSKFLFPMVIFVYFWPIIPHMSFYNNWNNVILMMPIGFLLKSLYGK